MITIKTKLHPGIVGGGEVVTHWEYKTTPSGLTVAIKRLEWHRTRMVASYGNIGAGMSWLEIDGVAISDCDLDDIMRFGNDKENAADLLKLVSEGKYDPSAAHEVYRIADQLMEEFYA